MVNFMCPKENIFLNDFKKCEGKKTCRTYQYELMFQKKKEKFKDIKIMLFQFIGAFIVFLLVADIDIPWVIVGFQLPKVIAIDVINIILLYVGMVVVVSFVVVTTRNILVWMKRRKYGLSIKTE